MPTARGCGGKVKMEIEMVNEAMHHVTARDQLDPRSASIGEDTCTADLRNLATDSKSLDSRYLGYGLCDIIVVYNFGS